VTHHDVDADFRGETLQFHLPQPRAGGVAAAAIGGNGQSRGGRITWSAGLASPAAVSMYCEGRGAVAHANADSTGIGGEIVDALGRRAPEFLDQKTMHPNGFRLAYVTPRPISEPADL
jgi:hypothetical protein